MGPTPNRAIIATTKNVDNLKQTKPNRSIIKREKSHKTHYFIRAQIFKPNGLNSFFVRSLLTSILEILGPSHHHRNGSPALERIIRHFGIPPAGTTPPENGWDLQFPSVELGSVGCNESSLNFLFQNLFKIKQIKNTNESKISIFSIIF